MFDWLFNLVYQCTNWVQILLFIVFLVVGLFLLIKGADVFVDSASSIAERLKIPSIIIGLTIVAFGTSAPEASVSISSAIMGSNGISIGNIIGSNMFNLFIILGLSALFVPVAIKRDIVKRDVLVMVLSSVLLLIFSLFFAVNGSYELLRWEGIIMLVVFVAYMVYVIVDAKKKSKIEQEKSLESDNKQEEGTENKETNSAQNEPKKPAKQKSIWLLIGLLLLGLIAVVAGGEFVTFGAKNIAEQIGVSEALVGLTIVAVGTSLPELITSIVALKKKETDIALGNIIGSNIFNTLFILAASSAIAPLVVSLEVLIYTICMTVFFILFFVYALSHDKISKKAGAVMLLAYAVYFVMLMLVEFL